MQWTVNLTGLSLLQTLPAPNLCQALGWGLESMVSVDWLAWLCPALSFKGHVQCSGLRALEGCGCCASTDGFKQQLGA